MDAVSTYLFEHKVVFCDYYSKAINLKYLIMNMGFISKPTSKSTLKFVYAAGARTQDLLIMSRLP
jgi:hypothetical protein